MAESSWLFLQEERKALSGIESSATQGEPSCKLCDRCSNIFNNWEETEKEIYRNGSTFDMDGFKWRTDLNDGCTLCLHLFDSVSEERARKIDEDLEQGFKLHLQMEIIILRSRTLPEDYLVRLNILEPSLDKGRREIGRVRLIFREPSDEKINLTTSTNGDISLGFAKLCIKRCRKSHSECKETKPVQIPTRLIEITGDIVRLIVSAEKDLCPEYTTLSHCWGKLQILKLTKSNIGMLMTEIPQAELCKTFQDAIMVTQALGFSYLWIDSLCIIQDDESDWLQESASMSNVYGNAVVNIAATKAKDGSAGLFAQRDPARIVRKFLQTSAGDRYELSDPAIYDRCIEKASLSNRAWAFQERYLANRTLFFTAEQIFYECRHYLACETWPEGIDVGTLKDTKVEFPSRKYIPTNSMPRKLEWERVVCFYSRAQLTFANDKFVALSGVARRYQNASQDQYIAGLWRSSFAEQLCWKVLHSRQRKKPTLDPVPYRAPTWSWASTDEPVTWVSIADSTYEPLFRNPSLIDIIELRLLPDGQDTFGRLQDGTVKIKCGPILTETLDMALKDHKRVINRVYFDDSTTKIPERNENGQNSTSGIYFLPVHRGKRIRLHGLILRSSERGKGYFTRIGNWEAIFGQHTYEYVVQNLLLGSKFLMEEALYEEVLESENGVPQYSITLV